MENFFSSGLSGLGGKCARKRDYTGDRTEQEVLSAQGVQPGSLYKKYGRV